MKPIKHIEQIGNTTWMYFRIKRKWRLWKIKEHYLAEMWGPFFATRKYHGEFPTQKAIKEYIKKQEGENGRDIHGQH